MNNMICQMMHFNSAKAVFLMIFVVPLFAMKEQFRDNNISLIASIPLHNCVGPRNQSLKRGLEILTAAQIAVNDINDVSGILSNYDLQLIVFDSCNDENEIIQQFIDITYYQSSKGIIRGITGFFNRKVIPLLWPLVRERGIVMTLPSEVFVYRKYGRGVLATNSPTTMANALLTFIKRMNWERFGLIAESTDTYYFNVAEYLLQTARTNETIVVSPYIELLHLESAIHEIIHRNTKVIIVSLPAQKVAQMICLIDKVGLLWPDYAWIFHSCEIETLLDQAATCDLDKAFNGIFIIQSQIKSNYNKTNQLLEENGYYKTSLRHNSLATKMYNLILLTAIKVNNTSSQSIDNTNQVNAVEPCEFQIVQYDNDKIFSIFHIWRLSKNLIGTIHSNLSIRIFNESVLAIAPIDDLPVVSIDPPIGYTVCMASLIVLLTIFVTLMLVLYIYFRKEPEIKATSFALSLFLFTGCYFNLLYISLLNYFDHHVFNALNTPQQNAVCNLLLWFSAPSISMPLMLATLLVKMLRVYHFFNHTVLRMRRYSSNFALVIYILLILTPNIIINLVWIFIDQYHVIIEYEIRQDYIKFRKDCGSKYESVWLGVLCIYLLLLALAIAVVAIMTRKVRLQHFKDTKKVNILLFSLCLGIIITFSYWLLFQILKAKPYIVSIPLIIGHSFMILSFQSLLFVPKIFPPFWRCINRK